VEADEEEFALPDIAEGELLDSLVLDDDETAEQIELSEEDLATIEIVEAFSTSAYSDEVRQRHGSGAGDSSDSPFLLTAYG